MANKNSKRNDVYVYSTLRTKRKQNELIFLYEVSPDYQTLTPVPLKLDILNKHNLNNEFDVSSHAFDRDNNVMYFSNGKIIIRYAVESKTFSLFQVPGFGFYSLKWVDKGYLYFVAYDRNNDNIRYLNSVSIADPSLVKKQLEYGSYSNPDFEELDGENQMFVYQNYKYFLMNADTLQLVPASSVFKIVGGFYASNNTGIVNVRYVETGIKDTIRLNYKPVWMLKLKNELIIAYNSAIKARNIEVNKGTLPSEEELLENQLIAFFKTKNQWFNKIIDFNTCMKEKLHWDCNPLKDELRTLSLEKKLEEVYFLYDRVLTYETHLKNKQGVYNIELLKSDLIHTKSMIMRVQKDL